MKNVISRDGTRIAYEAVGQGPGLILVGGTFEHRAFDSETAQLAALPILSEHFTVFHYDRRGRGNSNDTMPYAVEREIEDIEALIAIAGGCVFLSGISSGAVLAMEAAIKLGDKVKKLAMYEPPYNDSFVLRRAIADFKPKLKNAIASDNRTEAVSIFLQLLGVPPEQVEEMYTLPIWPMFETLAPTLAYEMEILGEDGAVPILKAARIAIPTVLICGTESGLAMQTVTSQLAKAIPNSEFRTLPGQNHRVDAAVLANELISYFADGQQKNKTP